VAGGHGLSLGGASGESDSILGVGKVGSGRLLAREMR
jgi:hypothetical protein